VQVIGAAINVRDLDTSVDFYTTVLGLHEIRRNQLETMSEATLSADPAGGFPVVVLAQLADPTGAPGEWGRVVLGVDDVDQVVDALRARGLAVGDTIDVPSHGVRIVLATDPDGHALELVQLP